MLLGWGTIVERNKALAIKEDTEITQEPPKLLSGCFGHRNRDGFTR